MTWVGFFSYPPEIDIIKDCWDYALTFFTIVSSLLTPFFAFRSYTLEQQLSQQSHKLQVQLHQENLEQLKLDSLFSESVHRCSCVIRKEDKTYECIITRNKSDEWWWVCKMFDWYKVHPEDISFEANQRRYFYQSKIQLLNKIKEKWYTFIDPVY